MTDIIQLYINDAHALGRHSTHCSPQNCPEINQLHSSGDHSKCQFDHCPIVKKEHQDGSHFSCSLGWCPDKLMVEKVHGRNEHKMHICTQGTCPFVKDLHEKDDHTLCSNINCSSIKQRHSDNDHTFCKGPVCSVKFHEDSRQKAHDRGFHSQFCKRDNCSEVAKSHQTDHVLCDTRDCEIKRLSHETDHKLCGDDFTLPARCLANRRITGAHLNNTHSESCNAFTCDAVKTIQANAHENGTHSLYCNNHSCPDVAESHATDHNLCSGKFCSFVKSRCNADHHELCKWGSCSSRYYTDRKIRQFLLLDDES